MPYLEQADFEVRVGEGFVQGFGAMEEVFGEDFADVWEVSFALLFCHVVECSVVVGEDFECDS